MFSEDKSLIAYVDGSYSDAVKKYAFGCVFILPDGRIYTEFGNGDNPESIAQRNVSGEMLGAMYAVNWAVKNGFKAIDIYYDYQGIESWAVGSWKAKNEHTKGYAAFMKGKASVIAIRYHKVPAHSKVKYNELADKLAKQGVTDGEGIPAVRLIEEMMPYGEDEA